MTTPGPAWIPTLWVTAAPAFMVGCASNRQEIEQPASLPKAGAAEVEKWVRKLGAADLEERDGASGRLLELGARDAESVLRMLPADDPDPEVQRRCTALRSEIPPASFRVQAMRITGGDPTVVRYAELLLDSPRSQAHQYVGFPLADREILAVKERARKCALIACLLLDHPDPALSAACWTMVKHLDREVVAPAMIRRLDRGQPESRARAIYVLSDLGERSAIPRLLELLEDPDNGVRISAAQVLGRFKDLSVVPKLVELLKRKDADVRYAAMFALGYIKPEAAFPEVRKMTRDSNVGLRRSAVRWLGEMKSQESIPDVVDRLADEDALVRGWAVDVLVQLQASSAARHIVLRLEDKDTQVQGKAMDALKMFRFTPAMPEILKAGEKNPWLAWRAAETLAAMGDVSWIPIVVRLMKLSEPSTRSSGAAPMLQIVGRAPREGIESVLKHEDPWARKAAVIVLGFNTEFRRDPKSNAKIASLLEDADTEVRVEAACYLLGGHRRNESRLVDAARDWWQTQRKAPE